VILLSGRDDGRATRRNCLDESSPEALPGERWIDGKSIDLNFVAVLLPRNQTNKEVVQECTHPRHLAEFANLALGLNELWDPAVSDQRNTSSAIIEKRHGVGVLAGGW
jgi:hypothetical protein